jgi:hypothetical protein
MDMASQMCQRILREPQSVSERQAVAISGCPVRLCEERGEPVVMLMIISCWRQNASEQREWIVNRDTFLEGERRLACLVKRGCTQARRFALHNVATAKESTNRHEMTSTQNELLYCY